MGELTAPTVTYTVWDHQNLTREVARLNAEMKAVSDYVVEFAQKHNHRLADTSNAMNIVEGGMREHDGLLTEANRKLGIVELAQVNHDQRILSCDQWLKTLCTDIGDPCQELVKKLEASEFRLKSSIGAFEESFYTLDLDARMRRIEDNIDGVITDCTRRAAIDMGSQL